MSRYVWEASRVPEKGPQHIETDVDLSLKCFWLIRRERPEHATDYR